MHMEDFYSFKIIIKKKNDQKDLCASIFLFLKILCMNIPILSQITIKTLCYF